MLSALICCPEDRWPSSYEALERAILEDYVENTMLESFTSSSGSESESESQSELGSDDLPAFVQSALLRNLSSAASLESDEDLEASLSVEEDKYLSGTSPEGIPLLTPEALEQLPLSEQFPVGGLVERRQSKKRVSGRQRSDKDTGAESQHASGRKPNNKFKKSNGMPNPPGSKAARHAEMVASKRAARALARSASTGFEEFEDLFRSLASSVFPSPVDRVPLPRMRHGEARPVAALAAQYGLRLQGKGRQAWVVKGSENPADALALRRFELRAEHGQALLAQQGKKGFVAGRNKQQQEPPPGRLLHQRETLVDLRQRTGKALRKSGRGAVTELLLSVPPEHGGLGNPLKRNGVKKGERVTSSGIQFVAGGVILDGEGGERPKLLSVEPMGKSSLFAAKQSVQPPAVIEVETKLDPSREQDRLGSSFPLEVVEDRGEDKPRRRANEEAEVVYCSTFDALSLEDNAGPPSTRRDFTMELALGMGISAAQHAPIDHTIVSASPPSPKPSKKQIKAQRKKALREADLLRAAGLLDEEETSVGLGMEETSRETFLSSETVINPSRRRAAHAEFGGFERHTTGIGSKLMRQWGFQGKGHGLGRDGEGVAEPIQVFRRAKNAGLGAD